MESKKEISNDLPEKTTQVTQPSSEEQVEEKIKRQQTNKLSKEWNIVRQTYKIDKIVGSGACGVVVRAKHRTTKATVAIKYIKASYKDKEQYVMKRTLRELQILRQLTQMKENLHTTKILDIIVSDDDKDIFIVMNLVTHDLNTILKQQDIDLTEENTITILFQLLCALSFIHQANVMHRDLKPGNILLDEECNLQLCDFGLARTNTKIETSKKDYSREELTKKLQSVRQGREKQKRNISAHVTTRYYRAPEIIILEKKYKNSLDMWSAGCILAELIAKQEDYKEMYPQNRPFFAGKYCEPLSPNIKGSRSGGQDQMQAIMEVLGPLDDADTCFITEPTVEQHLQSVQGIDRKVDFCKLFPHSDKELVAILQNMLEFNPYMRKKPEELLQMDIFKTYRASYPELLVPPTNFIQLEVDGKSVFDYRKSEFKKITSQELKNLFHQELVDISNMTKELQQ